MTAVEKPIPPNILDNVVPPNEDYDYFENCREHPFRYASDKFEMVNAWWLAEAALLAYTQPQFAIPRFQDAGLPEVEFFSGESTQCYVGYNDDFVLVVFSGTELRKREGSDDIRNIVADWLVNLDIGLVDSGQGGKVHEGFKEALDEVWSLRDPAGEDRGLKPYLDKIGNEGSRRRAVWFTGHSLGSALAALAADRYGSNVPGLYTFGSPRVGNRAFANDFHISTYRFVNNDDVVPRVPLPGLYRHVGSMKYIDSKGVIHDNPSLWERLEDSFHGELAYISNLDLLRLGFVRQLPDSCFTDHAPIYYAVYIWNSYVRDLRD
jgi:triacylglycerol lipase